ncbi:MAG: U32 family peptidase C-terminal domain-containing protein, partial [Coriobacteriales bacterium]|nr:U32 family peptidase C-terminal domain-containing protein [Coriobacteriales bacterium]
ESDLAPLRDYLVALECAGVDAVIVSDLATVQLVRSAAPGLDIHISTQASCTNSMAARMWYEMGAKRVVLARELSLAEIAAIRANTPECLELEVFVHGAMCMAYSGRCLISNFLTGRDANRGHCGQPCRWRWGLAEERHPDVFYPVEETERGSFIMNSKDLMMLEHLDELAAAGVDSIKSEGRVKGAYYVATVVNAYRQVLDGAPAADYLGELEAVSHRPYHTGFFYGPANQSPTGKEYSQTHDWVAVVDSCQPEGEGYRVDINLRTRFAAGEELEVLRPGVPAQRFFARELRDEDGLRCDECVVAMRDYSLLAPFPLERGDLLRKRRG